MFDSVGEGEDLKIDVFIGRSLRNLLVPVCCAVLYGRVRVLADVFPLLRGTGVSVKCGTWENLGLAAKT